jgi:hypothetical protein
MQTIYLPQIACFLQESVIFLSSTALTELGTDIKAGFTGS